MGGLYRDVDLGVAGGGPHVRGADDLVEIEQGMVFAGGLAGEDVQRGASHPAVAQGRSQRFFVDQTADRSYNFV